MEPLTLAMVALIGYLVYENTTYKKRRLATRVLWRKER